MASRKKKFNRGFYDDSNHCGVLDQEETSATADNNDILDAAITYANAGISVFPCLLRDAGDKKAKAPHTDHGFKDASTHPEQIRSWWANHPDATIGIPTGKASGLVVVDIDPRNGGDHSLQGLTDEHSPLPETLTAITGGGGTHYYFRYPDCEMRCSNSKIASGIDVKADGGYVIIAPSGHESGKSYFWDGEFDLDAVADMPQWLLELIDAADQESLSAATGDGDDIPEGGRNNALTSLAGVMRHYGRSEPEIFAAIEATNKLRCKPPLPESEVRAIAKSICRYEPDQAATISIDGVPGVDISAFTGAFDDQTQRIVHPGSFSDRYIEDLPVIVKIAMDYYLSNAFEAQPVMFLASFIAATGAVLGHKVKDATGLRTNIYTVGVLTTGGGKEATREEIFKIFDHAGIPEMCGPEELISDTGILSALQVQNPLLFQLDEFGMLTQNIKASQQTSAAYLANVASILMKLYSKAKGTFRGKAYADSRRNIVINQPHACLYGTTVARNFWESLGMAAVDSGFLPRFMIFESPSVEMSGGSTESAPPVELISFFSFWANRRTGHGNLNVQFPDPMVVPFTPEAMEIMDTFRAEQKIEQQKYDELGPLWSRARENAGKLAMIHACWANQHNPVVDTESATWAVNVTRHVVQQTLWRANISLVDSPFHALCQKALNKLIQSPDGKLMHSKLLKRMKIKTKDFKDLIDTLAQSGDIDVIQTVRDKGWPLTEYQVKPHLMASV
jgi:hypothetical protein